MVHAVCLVYLTNSASGAVFYVKTLPNQGSQRQRRQPTCSAASGDERRTLVQTRCNQSFERFPSLHVTLAAPRQRAVRCTSLTPPPPRRPMARRRHGQTNRLNRRRRATERQRERLRGPGRADTCRSGTRRSLPCGCRPARVLVGTGGSCPASGGPAASFSEGSGARGRPSRSRGPAGPAPTAAQHAFLLPAPRRVPATAAVFPPRSRPPAGPAHLRPSGAPRPGPVEERPRGAARPVWGARAATVGARGGSGKERAREGARTALRERRAHGGSEAPRAATGGVRGRSRASRPDGRAAQRRRDRRRRGGHGLGGPSATGACPRASQGSRIDAMLYPGTAPSVLAGNVTLG